MPNILQASSLSKIKDYLTWLMPPLVIPALRYCQDPLEERNKLFARDFSTYSLGAGLFLGVKAGLGVVLKKTGLNPDVQDFVSFAAALTLNLLYAGLVAPNLSAWLKPSNTSTPAAHEAKETYIPKQTGYQSSWPSLATSYSYWPY
jgi:hypothetical protein